MRRAPKPSPLPYVGWCKGCGRYKTQAAQMKFLDSITYVTKCCEQGLNKVVPIAPSVEIGR